MYNRNPFYGIESHLEVSFSLFLLKGGEAVAKTWLKADEDKLVFSHHIHSLQMQNLRFLFLFKVFVVLMEL